MKRKTHYSVACTHVQSKKSPALRGVPLTCLCMSPCHGYSSRLEGGGPILSKGTYDKCSNCCDPTTVGPSSGSSIMTGSSSLQGFWRGSIPNLPWRLNLEPSACRADALSLSDPSLNRTQGTAMQRHSRQLHLRAGHSTGSGATWDDPITPKLPGKCYLCPAEAGRKAGAAHPSETHQAAFSAGGCLCLTHRQSFHSTGLCSSHFLSENGSVLSREVLWLYQGPRVLFVVKGLPGPF